MVHLLVDKKLTLGPSNRLAQLLIFSGLPKAEFRDKKLSMAGIKRYDSPERDLSPLSEEYVPFVMPKGSMRRPANSQSFNQVACILHIESLNPNLDTLPLPGLTLEWLNTATEEMPEHVDGRLHSFMHEHDAYELKPEAEEFAELVKRLIRGTELEELEDYQLFVLEPRILERLRYLSRRLSERCYIKHVDGKLAKSDEFVECWKSRETYWKPKSPIADHVDMNAEAEESYDEDAITGRTMPPPQKTKRNLFSAAALARGKLLEHINNGFTPSTPIQKKRALLGLNTRDQSSGKRQRISKSRNSTHEFMGTTPPPPPNLPPGFSNQSPIHSNENEHEIEEAVRFGREFLSSPTPDLPEPAAVSFTPTQQKVSCEPSTPVLPDSLSRRFSREVRGSNAGHPAQLVKSALQTPSTSQRFTTSMPTPSRDPQITFHFQRPTGVYNLDDGISASDAHDFFSSDLLGFFQMAARQFCVALEELGSVTFRYGFEGFEAAIVHIQPDTSLDDWDLLKEKLRRQFRNSRMLYPSAKHFDVLVGPGKSGDQ